MKFAYYPGCNAEEISKQLDVSTKLVCKKLGIDLVDFDDFSCCGSGALEGVNSDFNLAVNARNFALSEKKKLDIITICSTCYNVMKKAKYELQNKEKLDFVNKILRKQNLNYKNKADVVHFSKIFNDKKILNKIKKLIKRKLRNLKVASFYGCHMLRPSGVTGENDKNYLENMVEVLGATPLDLKSKYDCCGLHISLVNEKSMLKMTGSIVNEAKEKKADLIVTLCTLCHFSLDANQSKSRKYYGKQDIPVLFLPQLIGLGMGLSKEELGINRNIIKSKI